MENFENVENKIVERQMPPADENPQFIMPPDDLSKKIKYVDNGGVTPELLEQAETVIKDLKPQYEEWVLEDLEKLNNAYSAFEKQRDFDTLKEVFEIVHDMKGQGGSFNYQLITLIGNKLCRIIEARLSIPEEPINDLDIEITKVHIEAIIYVINNKMEGYGGIPGETLLREFDSIIEKFFKRYEGKLPEKI